MRDTESLNMYRELINNLTENEKRILGFIQKNGPITKYDLVNETDTTLTTLNRILKSLKSYDLVSETGIAESTGGRKPVIFGINKTSYFILGVDISRTYTNIVLCNLKYEIIDSRQFVMIFHHTPKRTVDKISIIVEELIARNSIDRDRILGVGLGTIGPIDIHEGVILTPGKFPANGWTNVPIKDMLSDKLELMTHVDNGANTALLAEYYYGIGKSVSTMAYFNCGIGIRTSYISNNQIIRASFNSEEAFAHMVIDINGRTCSCGNQGCIESYSTIGSMEDRYEELTDNRLNFETLDNSIEYDPSAEKVIKEAAVTLGTGISNYIKLLNPESIVVRGPIIDQSDYFYATCIDSIRKNCSEDINEGISIHKEGTYGNDAIAIGAAVMFIERSLMLTS